MPGKFLPGRSCYGFEVGCVLVMDISVRCWRNDNTRTWAGLLSFITLSAKTSCPRLANLLEMHGGTGTSHDVG